MPYGEHRALCLHCCGHFTCGDAIVSTCPGCEHLGHTGDMLDCPVCRRESAERRAWIDAAIAARGLDR